MKPETVTLIYTGPLPEGYVNCPHTGVEFRFKAGEPVEFPAVTAAGLNPAIWQPVPKKGTAKKD